MTAPYDVISAVQYVHIYQCYRTVKYRPSTATFACHIPSLRARRKTAGAGRISTNATGTRTTRTRKKKSVIPGLMTRK